MINKRTGKKLNMFFCVFILWFELEIQKKIGKNEFKKKTRKVKGKENE